MDVKVEGTEMNTQDIQRLQTYLTQIADSIDYLGIEVKLLRQEIENLKISKIIDKSREK